MLTVIFREFKAVFKNIKSVVCLVLFAALSGVLFVLNNLSIGYAKLENVLSSITLISALIVPLVVIFSVSKERREGSDRFLDIMPFTRMQIVLGKFFGLLAAFGVPLATVALYPIILGLFGASGTANDYVSFAMLCAMVAFLTAFSFMVVCFCEKTWKAIVVSYAILIALFLLGTLSNLFESNAIVALIFFAILSVLLGLCVYFATRRIAFAGTVSFVGVALSVISILAFPDMLVNSIPRFFEFLSPFTRFDPIVFGIFDISSLIFYLSLSVVFLWFSALGIKASKSVRKQKKRVALDKRVSILASVVILACLTVNITVGAIPILLTQVDVSNNKLYSVSSQTRNLLKSLDEDITVYIINKNMADESSVRYTEKYCALSSKITIEEINTQTSPEFLSNYGLEGQTVPSGSIVVKSKNRWRFVSAEDYFTYYNEELGYVSLSDLEYYINYYEQIYQQYAASSQVSSEYLSQIQELIDSMYNSALCFCAEQSISEAVEYVIQEYIPVIYFISGHGEKNTSANPLETKGLSEIPKSAGLLIANSPTQDYTAAEIEVLLRFMEQGGRIIFLTNQANSGMPNISRLFACYGLSVSQQVITKDGQTKIEAISNTSSSTKITLSGASEIISSAIDNISVVPLITVDVESVQTENSENEGSENAGGAGEAESKLESKTLAAVAYKNNAPALSIVTGADTFNVADPYSLSETEQQEYLLAMSFLQSISTGMKKTFQSELSLPSPTVYSNDAMSVQNTGVRFASVIVVAVVPLTIAAVPALNIYTRKKRSRDSFVEQ